MGAVKVSVSIDEKELRWMKRQAKKRKTTLSALVSEAVGEWRRTRALELLIEELGGPLELGQDELAAIRAEWQD